MQYWLVKQEPESYPWSTFVRDGCAVWSGIRNYQARNNLRQMRAGDLILYYHSVSTKEVVGVAKVVKEAYPDPTAQGDDWSAVDIAPFCAVKCPVSLSRMKVEESLKDFLLFRHTRLSVMPVSKLHFLEILKIGETPLSPIYP